MLGTPCGYFFLSSVQFAKCSVPPAEGEACAELEELLDAELLEFELLGFDLCVSDWCVVTDF